VLDTEDNAGRYLALMRVDKKAEGGEIKFVVVDGLAPHRCAGAGSDGARGDRPVVRELIPAL
jgi:3-dehydroquinate synthetase